MVDLSDLPRYMMSQQMKNLSQQMRNRVMFGEVPPLDSEIRMLKNEFSRIRMLENVKSPQNETPIVTVISISGMLGPDSLEVFKSNIDAAFKPRYS